MLHDGVMHYAVQVSNFHFGSSYTEEDKLWVTRSSFSEITQEFLETLYISLFDQVCIDLITTIV